MTLSDFDVQGTFLERPSDVLEFFADWVGRRYLMEEGREGKKWKGVDREKSGKENVYMVVKERGKRGRR